MKDWAISILTSAGVTAFLAFGIWFCRAYIAAWLTKGIEHDFNVELEAVRAEFRKQDELLRADLREKENAIALLRSGAVSAMASRQIAVDKRTLEAIDQLWSAVTALSGARTVCHAVSAIKFDAITDADAQTAGMRQMFQTYEKLFNMEKADATGANKARPYVSPMAWALYSAYSAIVMQAVMRVKALASGINPKKILNQDGVGPLVKAALPHMAKFVDQHGDEAHFLHLDDLEKALLAEFRLMMNGQQADKAAVERAAEIVRLADEMNAKQSEPARVLAASDVPKVTPQAK